MIRPLAAAEFDSLMRRLGPFPPAPRVAVAVSGGADSLALALLAAGWAETLALIVDHGLRPESAAEAARVAAWLVARGIAARILAVGPLLPGADLSARARAARYDALAGACRQAGIVHLLLGHQALDQAETVLMRRLRGSGPDGLAGMAAVLPRRGLLLLRPLLGIPPARLRATLRDAGQDWVEDPTNRDARFLRPRLRALLADRPAGMDAADDAAGARRAAAERAVAEELAARVAWSAAGYAVLSPGPLAPAALSSLIQTVAGAAYPPPRQAAAMLAAAPRPATLAGVRLLPAGRLGPGWLVVREARAMAPPVPARPGASWDGRFRLAETARPPAGATLGALGMDARRLPAAASHLPDAVRVTLPALRTADGLFAAPHLCYPSGYECDLVPLLPAVPRPAAAPPFVAAGPAGCRTRPGPVTPGFVTPGFVTPGSVTPSVVTLGIVMGAEQGAVA
jgi:tRNA(Ile)-lysidine synthase